MPRHSIRTVENADIICQAIAEGKTASQAVRMVGFGNPSLVTDWVKSDATFAEMYARAKETQADRFAEELIEIADDSRNDWMQRELEGGEIVDVPDHEHINRSRLRVDTRKFLMAKMAPRKYGDKIQHEHSGQVDVAITSTTVLIDAFSQTLQRREALTIEATVSDAVELPSDEPNGDKV